MDNNSESKLLSNAEIKKKLDDTTKDLKKFDELAGKVEEQQELFELEKQLDE